MFGQTNNAVPLSAFALKNYFAVNADMTSATWNTVAKHEIATVTGSVHMKIIPEITSTLTDAADGASIQFGDEVLTSSLIGSTQCAGGGGKTLSTGELWFDTSASTTAAKKSLYDNLDFVIVHGLDVGYEITGAALTGGNIRFHVYWEEVGTAGGTVTAGAGGTL